MSLWIGEEIQKMLWEIRGKITGTSFGSVKNFVALVKSGSFLVRITDMTILIE